MPIYEFQCQACETVIEVLQKINDPHITDCEACGKPEMKKKVTAAAFRLSGDGWYETDFKEGDNKKNLTDNTETGSHLSKDTGASEKTTADKDSAASSTPKPETVASKETTTNVKDSSANKTKDTSKTTD